MSAYLDRICEQGLCIGCGICPSLAAPGKIAIVETPEGALRPFTSTPLSGEEETRIRAVCPGVRSDGLPEEAYTAATRVDPIWGPYLKLSEAWAGDPDIRHLASTGGVLTALGLFLLEQQWVDRILHVAACPEPANFGAQHLSEDRADVIAGAGSRYGPTATLEDIDQLLSTDGTIAFIGKPCDVTALRNYGALNPRVQEKVRFWLTLVCGGYMPTPDMRQVLGDRLSLNLEDVAALRYRGYGYPGPTTIKTHDGRTYDLRYTDFWGEDDSAWSLPFRCKICPDGIGEAADIVAADTWPGGSPDPTTPQGDPGEQTPGVNAVIVRTGEGARVFSAAARAGYLTVDRDIEPLTLNKYQPHQVTKKQAVFARYQAMAEEGRLVPVTRGLRITEVGQTMSAEFNESQRQGMRERIRRGRNDEPTPRPASRRNRRGDRKP